jgi:hypothetical protein
MTENHTLPEQVTPIDKSAEGVVLPRLVRLPNGAWVRPQAVTAVRPLITEKGSLGDLHRARVVVHHGAGFTEIILANDNEHAQAIADDLARVLNGEPNDQAHGTAGGEKPTQTD